MFKKIKKHLLIATCVAAISLCGYGVQASENNLENDNAIVEQNESIEATPETSVGVHNGNIVINEANFPDKYFRDYLTNFHDKDGDGVVVASGIESIFISNEGEYSNFIGIKSLKGIEYFGNLKWLDIHDTNIEDIDVTKNSKLWYFRISNNKNLNGTIDLSNCDSLMGIGIDNSETVKVILPSDATELKSVIFYGVKDIEGTINFDNLIGLDYEMITDTGFNKTTKLLKYTMDDFTVEDLGYGTTNLRLNIETDKNCNIEFKAYIDGKSIAYNTQVQTYGWQGWKFNGSMAGTSGEAKRLETLAVSLEGVSYPNNDLGIQYTTHCQKYGWLPWSANGEINGTVGEAKRLEAIKIQLTGKDAEYYDVYYRVHAQSYGWLGWAKNGEPSGTAGYAKRLEAIQIVLVFKGNATSIDNPGVEYFGVKGSSTNKAYYSLDGKMPVVSGENETNVMYCTHVQSYGWQAIKYNGVMSGTSGEAKRLEAIEIDLTNQQYAGDVVYTTHVQTYGWQGDPKDTTRKDWKKNGDTCGTSGEAKRLEAICIDLTGEMAENYDIYYRVHAQSYGWLGWAKNGEASGTAGYAKRLEGIQIVLVPKGEAAPVKNYGGITSNNEKPYISK